MEWLTSRPIAHRGLHDSDRPENSLAAFAAAVDAGYPLECDVRLSADDVPVVFHDETLGRLTDREDPVAATPCDRLQTLTLGDSDEQIPRFRDLLSLVDGTVPILVELKTSESPGTLESAVSSALDSYDGAFAVQSFNPRTVAWFRRHRPSWPRGQLSCFFESPVAELGPVQQAALKRLWSNWYTRPDFVGYDHDRLPYGPVARTRRRGTPVLAWTVRSTAALERVRAHADNVIFEEIRP